MEVKSLLHGLPASCDLRDRGLAGCTTRRLLLLLKKG